MYSPETLVDVIFFKNQYISAYIVFWSHSIWAQQQKHSAIVSNPNWENYEKSLYTNNWQSIYYLTPPTEYVRFSCPQFWCRIYREGNHRNYSGSQLLLCCPKDLLLCGSAALWQFWTPQDRCLLTFQVFSETWQCFTSSSTQKRTLKSYCYEILAPRGQKATNNLIPH